MKRLLFKLICAGFVFIAFSSRLGALEIEIAAGLDTFTYHPYKETAYSSGKSPSTREFEGYPFGVANMNVRGEFSGIMSFSVNVIRDNIWQNYANVGISARTDNFRFEFGPFAGVTDDMDKPDFGFMGSMEITWPGVLFASFSGASTLGSGENFTSNNHRESVNITFGFWLPGTITTFSIDTRSLSRYREEEILSSTRRDSLTRYMMSMEFFGKTSPFYFQIDAGYQMLTSNYQRDSSVTDETQSLFAGAHFNWQIMQILRIKAGFELPFMVSTTNPMTLSDNFWRFSRVYGGVIFRFF
ncbi:MAG: hypothetical protein FWB83_02425 [Treponema sp.]|nr:hypothetical protein [Treponema sp.]